MLGEVSKVDHIEMPIAVAVGVKLIPRPDSVGVDTARPVMR